MDQREPALVHHVPDPIPVRPIRKREDDLFAPLKDVDRCSIHTPRDSSAMHDNAEVRSPGRDGPKKGVRDELVDSSKPRGKGHPQDDSADGSVGGRTGTRTLNLRIKFGPSKLLQPVSMYPDIQEAMATRIDQFTFGSIRIDGVTYEHDVVIARGRVRKRKKKASKPFRGAFGHTPVSIEENIPWDCRRLVVGTGADGALPVMEEVKQEAARRQVDLLTVPTSEAIGVLQDEPRDTNAILHVTC
jgi:hypothetical protein